MNDTEKIAAVVASVDFGKASAAKRGRNPKWPYVPIIDYGKQAVGSHCTRTEQIRGKAFATRDEAVAYAQKHIDRARTLLAENLGERRSRALREHYGLPRELEDV